MFHPDLLSRFTTHLKEALQKSLVFALHHGRALIEPGDVLVGLLQEQGSIGCEILQQWRVTSQTAELRFAGTPNGALLSGPIAPDLTADVKRVLEACVLTAHKHEHKYIGTEHLLQALLELDLSDVQEFLQAQGVDLQAAREQVLQVLQSTARFPDFSNQEEEAHAEAKPEAPARIPEPARAKPATARNERVKALDVFARELTATKDVEGLDPVVGRDEEIERVTEILCRRTKNNPLLLGDPGVGKTAVVEGLAQRIVSGDVPDSLQGKRVFALDLALMVAGTMYRGEFEARLKQLVEEVKADKNILLFIDEIHMLVGAGSASGSMDAANILKPALARGEIHCIGATTWNEYKKHIESDAALERRYQAVHVAEPDATTTLKMLRALKPRYEEHHGVIFSETALSAAIQYADRHVTDRFFPDKAIDLLDEAAAHVNAQRRHSERIERLRALDVALHAAQEAKDEAVAKGDLAQASAALALEEKARHEQRALEEQNAQAKQSERAVVDERHVAQVVARANRVPLQTVLAHDRDRLQGLEQRLSAQIVGQAEAIQQIVGTLRHALLGLSDPQRPKASFLFVGPSGVGKTALAKLLAQELFGKAEALIKFDMSEFSEGHSTSKLLGSPAGYVGYRESGRLADTIRKNPHALFLFDEFEKAHADVQNILLQALEDGSITDATGRAVSLRQAYIVLTSNVGSELAQRGTLGFGATSTFAHERAEAIKEQLKDRFRPELLNRLDGIVVFRSLERDSLQTILRRELDTVLQRLAATQRGNYRVSDDVLAWLLNTQPNLDEGARLARRLVEQQLTSLLGQAVMERPKKHAWDIKVVKNKLAVR